MAVVKITIFQKDIHKRVSREDIQKISSARSQFLVLPEGFPELFQSSSPLDATKHEKEYQDHLLEISEQFPGVIFGGSHFRKNESGDLTISLPIVQSLVVVDFYEKKNPNLGNESSIKKGNTESIFIMGGLRFGFLLGEDIQKDEIWEEFQKEDIEIVFYLSKEQNDRSYEDDLKYFEELAKKKKIHLIRVCATGGGLLGRSLYASPSGINWKVGKTEEDKEVLKTLSVNLTRSYLL